MTSSTELTGRTIVVTGAGKGLGRACAKALSNRGAALVLVGRTTSDLEATADLLQTADSNTVICTADVADELSVQAAFDHTGPDLWGLVHCAGINRTGPTETYSIEDFDAVMHTNVRGAFLTARTCVQKLTANKRPGRIVLMSSQMGVVGYPGRAAYCASKHAVNGLVKAIAVEVAKQRITVNGVGPTFVETPLTTQALADEAFRAEVLRRIPAGRLATTDEVAAATTFLMSDEAGSITGQMLGVDGGWTAW